MKGPRMPDSTPDAGRQHALYVYDRDWALLGNLAGSYGMSRSAVLRFLIRDAAVDESAGSLRAKIQAVLDA